MLAHSKQRQRRNITNITASTANNNNNMYYNINIVDKNIATQ
jgi:hypothetical protein